MTNNSLRIGARVNVFLSARDIAGAPIDWKNHAYAGLDETRARGRGDGRRRTGYFGLHLGRLGNRRTAQDMAEKQIQTAVASALTPYCVLKSQTDPNRIDVQGKLDEASGYQHQTIIEKAGWATPLGEDAPNHQLARSCLTALADKS